MIILRFLCVFFISSSLFATDTHPDEAHHSHATIAKSEGHEKVYSCDLINYSGICRSYAIQSHQAKKLPDIKEGCESMPGAAFKEQSCPTKALVSKCTDIIRDHHHPDIVYDNFYYHTKSNVWSPQEIKRVCIDLGGTNPKK